VAAYCDGCPVLKAARGNRDVGYPVSVGEMEG
jgi:hypothetical protein